MKQLDTSKYLKCPSCGKYLGIDLEPEVFNEGIPAHLVLHCQTCSCYYHYENDNEDFDRAAELHYVFSDMQISDYYNQERRNIYLEQDDAFYCG